MPGFWEGYTKPEQVKGDYWKAGDYVGKALIVAEVTEQPNNSFDGKPNPRFLLRVVDEEGTEGLLPFTMGYTGRDETLKAIAAFLADGGDPVTIKLARVGRFLDIVPA